MWFDKELFKYTLVFLSEYLSVPRGKKKYFI